MHLLVVLGALSQFFGVAHRMVVTNTIVYGLTDIVVMGMHCVYAMAISVKAVSLI